MSKDVIAKAFETEKKLVGSFINNQAILELALDKGLTSDCFLSTKLKELFEGMLELFRASTPIDLTTVIEVSLEKSIFTNPAHIVNLSEAAPVSSGFEYLIDKVIENHKKTTLRLMVGEVNTLLSDSSVPLDTITSSINTTLLEIEEKQTGGLMSADYCIDEFLKELEENLTKDGTTCVNTGFAELDNLTGFYPNDLIILGGRPAMGKTAIALNFALKNIKDGKKVAIFSLEMSRTQITSRFISILAKIPARKLRTGNLSEVELDRVMLASQKFNKMSKSLSIDETPAITLDALRSRCVLQKRKSGLDIVYIDYLQLMGGDEKLSRERQLTIISGGLKALAKELKIPVVALCQVNRGVESRPNKRPKMSDIRESGGIEQDSDVVAFIYRDEYYHPDNTENTGVTEVILAKNRHGEVNTVNLYFDSQHMQFKQIEG